MDQQSIAALAMIMVCAVSAPMLAEALRRFHIPSVVIEIGLGILIGPQLLGLDHSTEIVDGLADMGLSFLMFLAGFEIDFVRIKGRPLSRAGLGWLMSLLLAGVAAGLLVESGFALSTMLIGLALTTTALGTLLPILQDAGVLSTRFGDQVFAIGTVGEFAPIVAIALLLSGDSPGWTAVLLVVFVGIAGTAAYLATRARTEGRLAVLAKHLHSSAQLPVRISVLLVVCLVWVASSLGLDVLLGAFAAGIVVRLIVKGPDEEAVQAKLTAIGFGFLIPVFFVVSGMRFDLDALLAEPESVLRVPVFLVLFLVVRGVPAFLLYRTDVEANRRLPLALLSATALPLVVVITTIGVDTGRMYPENAAALVAAGMLSVLLYPLLGLALLRRTGIEAEIAAAGLPTGLSTGPSTGLSTGPSSGPSSGLSSGPSTGPSTGPETPEPR